MGGYYLLAGLIFLVSMYVSNRLKSKFKKYSKIQLKNGMSGKEIAEKMLLKMYDELYEKVQITRKNALVIKARTFAPSAHGCLIKFKFVSDKK